MEAAPTTMSMDKDTRAGRYFSKQRGFDFDDVFSLFSRHGVRCFSRRLHPFSRFQV
jgi:hypothetical protein